MQKRETIRLSKDQPILQRNKRSLFRRRKRGDAREMECDFWRHFDLEKFATGWREVLGKRSAA